jgi:hypothetical protein
MAPLKFVDMTMPGSQREVLIVNDDLKCPFCREAGKIVRVIYHIHRLDIEGREYDTKEEFCQTFYHCHNRELDTTKNPVCMKVLTGLDNIIYDKEELD